MVLPKDLIANRDLFTAWSARTEYAFSTYWGSTAGNRVALVIPNMVIRSFGEADESRTAYWTVQFETAATGLRAALCLA